MLGEVGGQGRWPGEDVALHAAGFRRVLRAAGLIDAAPDEPAHAHRDPADGGLDAGDDDRLLAPGRRRWVTGWQPGRSWARSRTRSAHVLERPAAPMDGVVIFLVSSLAMNAGDPLLALAG